MGDGTEIFTHRVLRKPEVLRLTGLSAATVYRWIAEDRFPRPVKLGPNSVGWRWADIQGWLEALETTGPPSATGADGA